MAHKIQVRDTKYVPDIKVGISLEQKYRVCTYKRALRLLRLRIGKVRAHLTCDKQFWSLVHLLKPTYSNTPPRPYYA
uniref:AlNc14C43G3603 protein n=1 Tax=Albugo laibachii Nc14 TaxID=890382 RepID=F0WA59_9STRA|nr:AlNc14C43G3603 [Albugo laibachii Nc14]|eukprot:CCA18029.1 AlNc14C43G3603 [Albugo laibachii Nc14]